MTEPNSVLYHECQPSSLVSIISFIYASFPKALKLQVLRLVQYCVRWVGGNVQYKPGRKNFLSLIYSNVLCTLRNSQTLNHTLKIVLVGGKSFFSKSTCLYWQFCTFTIVSMNWILVCMCLLWILTGRMISCFRDSTFLAWPSVTGAAVPPKRRRIKAMWRKHTDSCVESLQENSHTWLFFILPFWLQSLELKWCEAGPRLNHSIGTIRTSC